MTRRLSSLTLDNLEDLPSSCRSCVAWELDPVAACTLESATDAHLQKQGWLTQTLLQWGSCGLLGYVDEEVAGFLTYAPSGFVPRSLTFPTSPISPDAVLLMTGGVTLEHRRAGIARMLAQGVAKDLTRRGVRAIECFATTHAPSRDDPDVDLGCTPGCLLPASFLLAVGFKTIRPHRDTPRLRLDLRAAVSWREDVEHALEKLLGTVRVPTFAPMSQPPTVPLHRSRG
ncbi:MAG: GNAT family N-acetyltransferase [Actinomycetales bacterium]